MSKIKIIRNNFPLHSPEWFANRLNSIGASEIGAVMGLSQYTPAAKLFLEKIGMIEQSKFQNSSTFWGLALEDLIADSWKYHEGEAESYIKNKGENKIMRECKKVNGVFMNTDHPYLTASPDRMITKGSFNLIDQTPLDKQCPLEIKTISDFESRIWETGIPVSYLAQVHGQMICTGTDYAELALLKSGKYFEVVPIKMSTELRDIIIEKTTDFWNNKIVVGKKLVAELQTADEKRKEEILLELHNLEPAPEGTPAYAEFLSERYKTTAKSRPPSKEEYELMLDYEKAQEVKKEGEKAMLLAKNTLLSSTGDYEEVSDNKCKLINRKKEGERAYFSIKVFNNE